MRRSTLSVLSLVLAAGVLAAGGCAAGQAPGAAQETSALAINPHFSVTSFVSTNIRDADNQFAVDATGYYAVTQSYLSSLSKVGEDGSVGAPLFSFAAYGQSLGWIGQYYDVYPSAIAAPGDGRIYAAVNWYDATRKAWAHGAVISVQNNGSDPQVLHQFSGIDDGGRTIGALTVVGQTIFGLTSEGSGTAYSVNTDGSGFATLHTFGASGDGAGTEYGLLAWQSQYVLGVNASGA